MIYDEFKKKYKKIIGWGTSGAYKKYGQAYSKFFSYLIDSDIKKWNTMKDTLKIMAPDSLKEESDCIIIIFSEYVEEIRDIVRRIGEFDIIDGRIVDYFALNNISIYDRADLFTVMSKYKDQEVVCSISTMLYHISMGGGARFVKEQTKILTKNNYKVFHIVPIRFYATQHQDKELLWVLDADSKILGMYYWEEISACFLSCNNLIIQTPWYALDEIYRIYHTLYNVKVCLFYLHDFSPVCSRHFLPADGKSCFKMLENQCIGCENADKMLEVQSYYSAFFSEKNVIAIAPSQIVADILGSVYPMAHIEVLPHYLYRIEESFRNINSKIRIAFIGKAVRIKGWEDFKKIVAVYEDRFEFYCFGQCDDKIDNVMYINTCFETDGSQLSTKDALKKYDIDIAYIGSIVCETYSYTYIEAFENSLYILTTIQSGNVCEEIKRNRNGYVGESVEDVINWLKQDDFDIRNILLQNVKTAVNVSNNECFLNLFNVPLERLMR